MRTIQSNSRVLLRLRRRFGIRHSTVLRSERDHWRKRAIVAEHEAHELHESVQAWLATDITRDEYEAQDEAGA